MTYRRDMLPFTSSWTPVSPQHTNNKSGLFLISNFCRILNVVFFGKIELTCFIWTKKEKSGCCIKEAAVEDLLFDSRKGRRDYFSKIARLFSK